MRNYDSIAVMHLNDEYYIFDSHALGPKGYSLQC